MERFSNNYGDLQKQLKAEFFAVELEAGEQRILRYMELPWFPGEQFAVSLIADDAGLPVKIVHKMWDHVYDLERFWPGVYNLDRLCVRTNVIPLSLEQQQTFAQLIANIRDVPETLEKTGYIMLDGVEYEMEIETATVSKSYQWKLATEDLAVFKPVLDLVNSLKV